MQYFWVLKTITNSSDQAFRDEVKLKTPIELEYEEPEIHRRFIMDSDLSYYQVIQQIGEGVEVYLRVKKEQMFNRT